MSLADVTSFNRMGVNPVQADFDVTDTDQLLSTAFDTAHGSSIDWTKIEAVILMAETNAVRISFGTAAVQGASSVGSVLAAGGWLRIPSREMVEKLHIINATNATVCRLHVVVER